MVGGQAGVCLTPSLLMTAAAAYQMIKYPSINRSIDPPTHLTNQNPQPQNETGPVLNKAADDDKKLMPADVSFDGPLVRYGLTDWKVYVPLGLAMSVPFLANEVRLMGGCVCWCVVGVD